MESVLNVEELPAAKVEGGSVEVRGGDEGVVGEEGGHGGGDVGAVGLSLGALSLEVAVASCGGFAGGEEEGGGEACGEREEDGGGGEDESAVSSGELAEAVEGAGWSGEDGLVAEESADVGGESGGGGVSAVGVFFDGFGDDGVEVAAEGLVEHGEAGGLFIADDSGGFSEREVEEVVGHSAGEAFEEDDAQGVDVRPLVDGGVEWVGGEEVLFRGDVAEGSDDSAGFGLEGGLRSGGVVSGAGDAEIEDFGVAGFVDEDVGGFEVSVDDALGVGEGDGVADSGEEIEFGVECECAGGVEEGAALDELHGKEGEFVSEAFVEEGSCPSGVEDGGDTGVTERGEELSFAVEAGEEFAGDDAAAHDFESDATVRCVLEGFVDDAHAAFA